MWALNDCFGEYSLNNVTDLFQLWYNMMMMYNI